MRPSPSDSGARLAGDRFAFVHLGDLGAAVLLVFGFLLGPLKLIGNSWFTYLAADGLVALELALVVAQRLLDRKPLLRASPLSLPIVLLAAMCVLELGNPEAPFIRSVIGLRSWLLYPALYFVGLYSFRSTVQLRRLYALLLALGLVTAAYGIYQWKVGPQAFATWSEQYGRYAQVMWSLEGGRIFRAFSTFVLPNVFGQNMALVMVISFGIAASKRVNLRWRVLVAMVFGVMGVGIAASGTRAPVVHLILAGAAGVVLLGSRGARLRLTLTVALLTTAGIGLAVFLIGPLVGPRFATIFDPESFFWKWFDPFRGGLKIAMHHPLGMGMGYTAGVPQLIANPVLRELPTTSIDSGYGAAAAELGFVGLLLFVYLAAKVALEGFRSWARLRPGDLKDLLVGPVLLACTYPIVSVIVLPQAILPGAIYFWLLMGILMKAPSLQEAVGEDQLLRSSVHSGQ